MLEATPKQALAARRNWMAKINEAENALLLDNLTKAQRDRYNQQLRLATAALKTWVR